jgi:uncharacterized membrane protein YfcA
MTALDIALLIGLGSIAGVLSGLLGIGGGILIVPALIALGHPPRNAVATASLSVIFSALSGTIHNLRKGLMKPKPILILALPSLLFAQLGVYLSSSMSESILLFLFGCLLILTIYLVSFRKKLAKQIPSDAIEEPLPQQSGVRRFVNIWFTGSATGLLSGLFGVGGGIILVPFQVLLLGDTFKSAIQTSLGVIVLTSLSSAIGHGLRGNLLWTEAILIGMTGALFAQLGAQLLTKVSENTVNNSFRIMLSVLALYFVWRSLT